MTLWLFFRLRCVLKIQKNKKMVENQRVLSQVVSVVKEFKRIEKVVKGKSITRSVVSVVS